MLTEPAELSKWWGPRGFELPAAELELRVNGRYRFTMKPPDGEPFHLSGTFLAVDPPGRLAYTFSWEEPGSVSMNASTRGSPPEPGPELGLLPGPLAGGCSC